MVSHPMLLGTTTIRTSAFTRRRHTRLPALRASAPNRSGAPSSAFSCSRALLTVALYVIAETGPQVEDPPAHRPVPRHRARPRAGGAHGQPMAGPPGQRRRPPPGRVAQRDRLRGDRPLGPRLRQVAGGLGRHRRGSLRPHAPGGALLAGPRALPLSPPAHRRHPAGRPSVLHPHQRRPTLDPLRQLRVPADRVLQDPPLHLLRLLFRLQQGAAVDPDGPPREPARPRPPTAHPHTGRLGRRHGDHRPGGRHRLRRPALRAVHRPALGHHRPGRLPRLRLRPLRHRRHLRRPLLQPGPRPGGRVAQSVATETNPNYSEQLSDGWFYMGTGASEAPGWDSSTRPRSSPRSPAT